MIDGVVSVDVIANSALSVHTMMILMLLMMMLMNVMMRTIVLMRRIAMILSETVNVIEMMRTMLTDFSCTADDEAYDYDDLSDDCGDRDVGGHSLWMMIDYTIFCDYDHDFVSCACHHLCAFYAAVD